MFESLDGGSTWQPVANQNGLVSLNVRALALDTATRTVYAGTDDGVAALTSYVALDAGEPPVSQSLLEVNPNPARSSAIRVFYTLEREAPVRIEVFDAAGRLVRVLDQGTRQAGRHQVVWNGLRDDGRPADAGLFLVRLRAASASRTARLVRLGK